MPSYPHYFHAFDRLECPDKDGVRDIGNAAHDIKLVVHSVNKINISNTTRAVHRLRSFGAASAIRMRRPVFRPAIRFDFNDLPRHAFTVWTRYYKHLAE